MSDRARIVSIPAAAARYSDEPSWLQLAAFAGAPIAWALQFGAGYFLVDFACGSAVRFVLYAIAALAIVGAAGATYLTWLRWQTATAEEDEESRFRAEFGLLTNGLFLLLTILTGAAVAVLSPCTH